MKSVFPKENAHSTKGQSPKFKNQTTLLCLRTLTGFNVFLQTYNRGTFHDTHKVDEVVYLDACLIGL